MAIKLDLYDLDKYIFDDYSFKGDQILEWCKSNLNSNDDHTRYAAQEIYNNYFIRNKSRSLNLSNYYYISYSNGFINGHLYTVIRDEIMSPKYDDSIPEIKIKDIFMTLEKIDFIVNRIKKKSSMYNDSIKSIRNLMDRRLKCIGIRNKNNIKPVYYNTGSYRRYQIYFIINTCLQDIKLIEYMVNKQKRRGHR